MSTDEQHVALPKLYGAPAYARPPRPVEEQEKPVDLDDLPLTVEQTPEEQELIRSLPARTYLSVGAGATRPPAPGPANEPGGSPSSTARAAASPARAAASLQPRPFRLRALTGRILRNDAP